MGSRLLWEEGLQKIGSNKGAMTPGIDGETFADFGPEDLDPIIASVTAGTYDRKPVRRVFIPKGKGKRRPLGNPTSDDRRVLAVARQLPDRSYEQVVPNVSHGFRPGSTFHMENEHVKAVGTGGNWVLEVDAAGILADNHNEQLAMA